MQTCMRIAASRSTTGFYEAIEIRRASGRPRSSASPIHGAGRVMKAIRAAARVRDADASPDLPGRPGATRGGTGGPRGAQDYVYGEQGSRRDHVRFVPADLTRAGARCIASASRRSAFCPLVPGVQSVYPTPDKRAEHSRRAIWRSPGQPALVPPARGLPSARRLPRAMRSAPTPKERCAPGADEGRIRGRPAHASRAPLRSIARGGLPYRDPGVHS